MRIQNRIATMIGIVGFGTLLSLSSVALTQDTPRGAENEVGQEGVEPLTSGPIHEAFATPVDSQPGTSPVVQKEPPAALEEVPPDQKPEGEDVEWLPGYWSWDEDRKDFIWVSGFWRSPPPGRRWLPGRWQAVDGGFQWVPGLWTVPQQTEMQYLPPPPESAEIGPSVPAPSENCVYVPGSWVYHETRYRWRPGTWIDYRPGWIWVPSHYCWTPCGYVFQDGYWDYELARRGLLFSPVFITPRFRLGVGWSYQPRFAVNCDFLYGSLFIGPRSRHYYFGDWFDAGYRTRGYVPWIDFRVGRHARDPLYSYYRVGYRNDPFWGRGIQDLYAGRYRGDVARPPRTFVQQNTQIKNVTINRNVTVNNINVTNINNVAAIGRISQIDRTAFKMQQVTPAQRKVEQQAAVQFRNVSQERARVETKLLSQGGPPTKSNATPRTAKIDFAAVRPVRPTTVNVPPPPTPATARILDPTPKKGSVPGKELNPAPKLDAKGGPPGPAKAGTNPPPKEAKPIAKPAPKELKPEVKPAKPIPKEFKPEGKPPQKPEGKPRSKPSEAANVDPAKPAPIIAKPVQPPPVTKPAPLPAPKVAPPPAPKAKEPPPPAPKAPPPPPPKQAPPPAPKAPPPAAKPPAQPPPAARTLPPPSTRPVVPAKPQTPPPSKPGGKGPG